MKKLLLILLLFSSKLLTACPVDTTIRVCKDSVVHTPPPPSADSVFLFGDDFNRASLGSNYTLYGTSGTASIVSNQLQISGGNSSGIADKVVNTSYLSTQKSITIATTITPTANGNGIKFVLLTPDNTQTIFGGVSGLSISFDCNNIISKRGFVKVKTVANKVEVLKCSTATGLAYTNSTDPIDIKIVVTTTSVLVTEKNTVTGSSVTKSFSYSSLSTLKRWQFGIVRNGGTVLIDKYNIWANANHDNSLILLSHSMGAGASATDKRTGWFYLVRDSLVYSANNMSGGGSIAQDVIDNVVCEYGKFSSSYTAIHIGTNDAAILISDTAFKIKLDTLIARVIASGSIPILCTELPTTDATKNLLIVKYNTKINSYAGTYLIADFYTLMKSGTILNPAYDDGSGLHPNTLGHLVMKNYFKYLTRFILTYK